MFPLRKSIRWASDNAPSTRRSCKFTVKYETSSSVKAGETIDLSLGSRFEDGTNVLLDEVGHDHDHGNESLKQLKNQRWISQVLAISCFAVEAQLIAATQSLVSDKRC